MRTKWLKRTGAASVATLLLGAVPVVAQEPPAPPDAAATPAPPPQPPPPAAAPKPPAVAVKVGGMLHVDGRLFLDDEAEKLSDDLLIRRARPDLQVKAGRFAGRLVLDFGGAKAVLQDAWVEASLPAGLKLRAGKYTPPIGPERLQSSNATFFAETALPSNFAPSRDVGLQLSGSVGKVVSVAIGLFDGAPDGGAVDLDSSDSKDVAGRIFVKPFATFGQPLLANLGLGLSGSYGTADGDPKKVTELAGYKSDGQATIFEYVKASTNPYADPSAENTAVASGRRTRLDLHGSWFVGPAGVVGEYAVSEQRVTLGAAGTFKSVRARHDAWQATALYNVTGEKASDGVIVPSAPVDGGGWGALQVVARFAALELDDDVFPSLAKREKSVSGATAFGAGLSWWPTADARLMLDYGQTSFDGGAGTAAAVEDRPTERAVQARVQLAF